MIFDAPIIKFCRRINAADPSAQLENSDWELLIRQARAAGMLGRITFLLAERGLLERIPDKPRLHLQSALVFSEANQRSVLWEIKQLKKALQPINARFAMLKGAAYVLKRCAAFKGRVFSDIDLMVHKSELNAVEQQLVKHGWVPSSLDAYNQHYYRQWMHEIPPMRHIKRETNLDVHHTILPPTVKLKPDVNLLWQSAQAMEGEQGVWVLSSADMIIHSATHLFYDGELEHGFRDLSDLDLLFRELGGTESWNGLLARACALELSQPLSYAIRYCLLFFETPVPAEIIKTIEPAFIGKLRLHMLDFLFFRGLMPNHASCGDRWTGLARWLLFVRSHYLRMPLYLLIPHLSRKAWLRILGKPDH